MNIQEAVRETNGISLKKLLKQYPVIQQMVNREEVLWLNKSLGNLLSPTVSEADVKKADARLRRFAPYLEKVFPETAKENGIIESPLVDVSGMREYLAQQSKPSCRLLLKCDNQLPISGSIKARGGIYEVLWLAEKIALEHDLLTSDCNYSIFDSEDFRRIFSNYSIAVGSTGNLGLSIGIMGSKLGFRVTVHMSADAKQWKKQLLRQIGADVVEYSGDYGKAVEEGRKQASQNPFCHFIDDENSATLFLGYATAADRLRSQLEQKEITVDSSHPLFVYLPCGVGGGPGGIAYGLKQIYGANVHCFFAEPIEAPCMLLGIMTGMHDAISVQDIGLTGQTVADGLAVGRASKFVGSLVANLLDGLFTVSDSYMENLTTELYKREGIFVEPSATAGFRGYSLIQNCADRYGLVSIQNATHIAWATGGGMVPQKERAKYIDCL